MKKQIFKSRVVDTFKPFNIADSPVFKRNVDLRNSMVRRSSMNLRGKRKSSAYGGLCRNYQYIYHNIFKLIKIIIIKLKFKIYI